MVQSDEDSKPQHTNLLASQSRHELQFAVCKICNYASALYRKHNHTNCMLKGDMHANLSREKKFCGSCWRPNRLKNHRVHLVNCFGLDCAHFSSKLKIVHPSTYSSILAGEGYEQ